MFDTGAHAACGSFGTQRQAFAVAVVKGVHLFFDHIGYFADGAFKQRSLLDDRHANFAVAVAGQHLPERTFNALPDSGIRRQVIVHAADSLNILRHVKIS